MSEGETAATAAMLVIGDEILSGRTRDKNIGTLADFLGRLGIRLREARIVPDEAPEIVAAVNALCARYTYVFTSGGIGPTHDDITADAVASAFGVEIDEDERALAQLRERYQPHELNQARRRMARIPAGADLIENRVSKAPGFVLGNVFVMAGVPTIFEAMLDAVAPRLGRGRPLATETVDASGIAEGLYAAALSEIAARRPEVSIGSYPTFFAGNFRNEIVVRGRDRAAVAEAATEIGETIAGLRREVGRG